MKKKHRNISVLQGGIACLILLSGCGTRDDLSHTNEQRMPSDSPHSQFAAASILSINALQPAVYMH